LVKALGAAVSACQEEECVLVLEDEDLYDRP
jgi:hypothetical protein